MVRSNDAEAMSAKEDTASACSAALLAFIADSPSPWHVVSTAVGRLQRQGYQLLTERDSWALEVGGRYVVQRDDAALVAFIVGRDTLNAGFRIIGAHTDSPGLRVKTQGAHESGGYLRLSTEIYGSPILATFTDRDLLLAGRVIIHDTAARDEMRSILIRLDESHVRLPNLPIHLNRTVNEDGLKVHKHSGLNLLFSVLGNGQQADHVFSEKLAQAAGAAIGDILSFELCAVDAQAGAFFGLNREFIASRQLDNLASCHAAIEALVQTTVDDSTPLIALFDHEEVGSESRTGASGTFLPDVMARVVSRTMTDSEPANDLRGRNLDQTFTRTLANSWMISADMAHAHHPSHPDCYDALHTLKVNSGVALKINSSQRYATNAQGEAYLLKLATEAAVPVQKYVHRADLACGSTVGPICAARLGLRTIDIGSPMWAMHSCRESAGAKDQEAYIRLMRQFLGG